MTITKLDIHAVLTRLTEAFPQAFELEQHQPHRPLKVGIFSEIAARCPDLARSDLATVLNIYTRRMILHRNLDTEPAELAMGRLLHLTPDFVIHVPRMRIEGGDHAADRCLDQLGVVRLFNVIGPYTLEHVAGELHK